MAKPLSRFYQPQRLQQYISQVPPMDMSDMYRLQSMKEAKKEKGEAIKNDVLGLLGDVNARSAVNLGPYKYNVPDADRVGQIQNEYYEKMNNVIGRYGGVSNLDNPGLQNELWGLVFDIKKNKTSGELYNIGLRTKQFEDVEKTAGSTPEPYRYIPMVEQMEKTVPIRSPLVSVGFPGVLPDVNIQEKAASIAKSLPERDLQSYGKLSKALQSGTWFDVEKIGDREFMKILSKKGVGQEDISNILNAFMGIKDTRDAGEMLRDMNSTDLGKTIIAKAQTEAYDYIYNQLSGLNPSDAGYEEKYSKLNIQKDNLFSDPLSSDIFKKSVTDQVNNVINVGSGYRHTLTTPYVSPMSGKKSAMGGGKKTAGFVLEDLFVSTDAKIDITGAMAFKKEPDNNGITATFDNLKKMADLYSQNAASYQNIPGGENLYAKNKLGEAVNHALIKYYGINEMEEKTLYEFRMVEKAENNFNNKLDEIIDNIDRDSELSFDKKMVLRKFLEDETTIDKTKDRYDFKKFVDRGILKDKEKTVWSGNYTDIVTLRNIFKDMNRAKSELQSRKTTKPIEVFSDILNQPLSSMFKSWTMPSGIISRGTEFSESIQKSNRPRVQQAVANATGNQLVLKMEENNYIPLKSTDAVETLDPQTVKRATLLPFGDYGYGFFVDGVGGGTTMGKKYIVFPSADMQKELITYLTTDLQMQLSSQWIAGSEERRRDYASLIKIFQNSDYIKELTRWDMATRPETDRDGEDSKITFPVVRDDRTEEVTLKKKKLEGEEGNYQYDLTTQSGTWSDISSLSDVLFQYLFRPDPEIK